MSKREFMEQLAALLTDLPEEERLEAVSYYEEYFEDAGPEREAHTMEELGSPEKVAAMIRENLYNSVEQGGVYTERGYQKSTAPKNRQELTPTEQMAAGSVKRQAYQYQKQNRWDDTPVRKGWNQKSSETKTLTVILLILFAIPIAAVVIAVFSVVLGIVASILGVAIAAVAVTISLLIVGVVLAIIGIVNLLSAPAAGVILCGIGFLLFGGGMLSLMLMVFVLGDLLPKFIKWTFTGLKRLIRGKVRMA